MIECNNPMDSSLPEGEVLSIETRKRNALFAILGICIVSSIAIWVFPTEGWQRQVTVLASAIAQLVSILFWCIADAEEREFDLSFGYRIFIVLFAFLGLPFYLIKTRGLQKGLISIAYAFLFWVLMYFVSVITLAILTQVEDRLGVFQTPPAV